MENPSPSEQAKFPVSELIRAILAFDHVIQDRDCPSGKFQWEQNQLIKLVRARDIPLNLAVAALTKLISRGEIEKGKSFVHLSDVTDLSGKCVTSSTVHDCYLHFLLSDWNTFIIDFKRQMIKEPAEADYPGQGLKVPEKPKPGRKAKYDPKADQFFADDWATAKSAKVSFKDFCGDRKPKVPVRIGKMILGRVRDRKRVPD